MPSIAKRAQRKRTRSTVHAASKNARNRPAPIKATANDAVKLSSVDHIVAEILRGLYEGRYVAGQKLTESDLTRRFRVGRGTVREALRRLAAEGVVTVSLHRGASIRALTRDDARDMLEVLEALSGLSARLAAERILRSADRKSLCDIVVRLTALTDTKDIFELARTRDRFYRELTRICANREVARLISMVQVHLIRVQFREAYGLRSGKFRSLDYERIVEAIVTQNGAAAERAMRQHFRRIARAIQQLPDHNFAL